MTPTLMIGLGGTGLHMLSGFKKAASASDSSVIQLEQQIKCLWIDTDTNPSYFRDCNPRLPAECSFNMGHFDVRTFLNHACFNDPQFTEWWDCNDVITNRMLHTLDNGSGIIRGVGRLGLYHFYSDIRHLLHSRIQSVAVGHGSDNSINIVIISSLCGGTGSGIFLDLSCLVRSICDHFALSCNLIGVFFLPEIYEHCSPMPLQYSDIFQSNTYASLIEWTYYESIRKQYRFGPQNVNITYGIENVYDVSWLIGLQDKDGYVRRNTKDYFEYTSNQLLSAIEVNSYQLSNFQYFITEGYLSINKIKNSERWKFSYEKVKHEEECSSPHNDKRFNQWLNESNIT